MTQTRMYNVIQPQFSQSDRLILEEVDQLVEDGLEMSEAIDTVAAERDIGRNGRIALYAHFGLVA